MAKINLTKYESELMQSIVDAGENGKICVAEEIDELLGYGFVEVAETDAQGNVPTRATAKGIEFMNGPTETPKEPKKAKQTTLFEIDDNVPLPPKKRKTGGSKYPFDLLEVGQSFHIPVSEENPDPAKRVASAVTNANRKWKNDEGVVLRHFESREVDENDPRGPGARIARTK